MPKPRVSIGEIRREQIVAAAVAIIDELGLQRLSLSEIETRAGMSRGQLTYYFPQKEDILLAVFDRLLLMMKKRVEGEHPDNPCAAGGNGWDRLQKFLSFLVLNPPEASEFHSLQYTFLSQIAHREDFRQRLANLYGEWRSHLAQDLAGELARRGPARTVSARTFATLVQAILHGLAMQRVADPQAYDRQEMLDLCLDLLGSYLGQSPRPEPEGAGALSTRPNGSSRKGSSRSRKGAS